VNTITFEWLSQAQGGQANTAAIVAVGGGAGGSSERYLHVQNSPAATWTVNHNLGVQPAGVNILSPGGVQLIAEVVHLSTNQLQVLFAAPQTGRVSII
jgi:hypothetical protein